MLDECVITGTTFGDGDYGQGQLFEKIEQLDADLSGFTTLCSSLGSSQIVSISLRKCYLGPQALTLLTDAIKVMVALNSLTVDSTGNMNNQKAYTLTAGEDEIQLCEKNLGSADVAVIAAWLKRPEVSAALTKVDVRGNKELNKAAVDALRAAAPETCEILADY